MNTDEFFNRQYDSKNYNCAHFTCEVWQAETGNDIRPFMTGYLQPREQRSASLAHFRHFTRVQSPVSPCIVLMQAPREAPHVGIYLRGRLFHICPKRGVRFDKLETATFGYKKIGFYVC